MEFSQISGDMYFVLYEREGDAMVKGVDQFKYLGQTLDQSNDNWPIIRQDISREWKVWVLLG